MNTETRSCVPTFPVTEAGLEGHDEAPEEIMHIVPVDAPLTGGEFIAAKKIVPISMKMDAETNVIFFKNYTQILRLVKKAPRLRLATTFLREA